jgi:hypothetical protein
MRVGFPTGTHSSRLSDEGHSSLGQEECTYREREREKSLPQTLSYPLKNLFITPGFKAKSNAHSMCAQESSLHTYCIENGYKITNVSI